MADINVRSDAVDVEQIMREIRARVREKRGVDYTEAEVQQLAKVKLEKFLDPRGVRSDLVAQFRTQRTASPAPSNYEFDDDTLVGTHRGALRGLRHLLRPILKLFFNPDTITTALHIQSAVNTQAEQRCGGSRSASLNYEIMHNLTVEITRLGIDVQNLKMRVESLSSRLDFDERRARSLEGVVQYRPATARRHRCRVPLSGAGPDRIAGRPESRPASGPGLGHRTQRPAAATPATPAAGTDDGQFRTVEFRARTSGTDQDAERAGSAAASGSEDSGAFEVSDGPDFSDGSDGPDSQDQ